MNVQIGWNVYGMSQTKNVSSGNLFQANISFLYPLKTSENQRLFNVFRGYRTEILTWKKQPKNIFTV